jgi:GWxTD domain-containing protein
VPPALVLAGLAPGCRSTTAPTSVLSWADGPVRWILSHEEERRFRRLSSSRDMVLFIEEFWRRRDPEPADPGNPFLETFHERVQAADRLYGERGLRGSLTDRGRALILLGPPPILRYGYRRALAPRSGGPGVDRGEQVAVEVWEYPGHQLPPGLPQLLEGQGLQPYVTLEFMEGFRQTRLISGERVLELAAQLAAGAG